METILASVSSNTSLPPVTAPSSFGGKPEDLPVVLSSRSLKQKEQAAQALATASVEERYQHQKDLHKEKLTMSARSRTLPSDGASTWRSDATATSSSTGSDSSSRLASSRASSSSRKSSGGNSERRSSTVVQQLSHRSARENRLRPPLPGGGGSRQQQELQRGLSSLPSRSSTPKLRQFKQLDPVFNRHHRYDLIAEEQAARGGEITGRFGPVVGSSVVAASLLTSELSTPWSHVLRGQKW